MPFKKFKAVAEKGLQATLAIHFLIVGGGVSGLACAVALRRVGHQVTVLERECADDLEHPRGPCRIPPNMSKILYRWGLENEVRSIAISLSSIEVALYETDEHLGSHVWDKKVLEEIGGDFLFTHHSALRKLLFNVALSCGATVRFDSIVESVDPAGQTVNLASGEQIHGNVVIGADGPRGRIIEEFRATGENIGNSQVEMYSATVPRTLIENDSDLSHLYSEYSASMFTWFGDGRSVLGFPIGDGTNLGFYIYGPSNGQIGSWRNSVPLEDLQASLSTAGPSLRKLCTYAREVTVSTLVEYPRLRNWVHKRGHVLVLGEAAHPLPPGSVQATGMAFEDSAVLGKLFSHLHTEKQIKPYLGTFQKLRRPRCDAVSLKEAGIIRYMTMGPGEEQHSRDAMMRARSEAGFGILQEYDGNDCVLAQWREIKRIFCYDAEDQADEWWYKWGRLQERANDTNVSYEVPIKILLGFPFF